MNKFFENIYTLITFITLLVGFVVALLFGVALIIGGPLATQLSVFAGDIMNWAIKLAALATAVGLIYIYFSKAHTLTLDSKDHIEK